MSTTKMLRLGPLPKTESIKLTFTRPASLAVDLDRCARRPMDKRSMPQH